MDEPRAVRRARPHNYSSVRLLQKVAVIANEASTFADAISETLHEVCYYTAWAVGHAYLVDRADAHLLRSSDLWSLPDRRRFLPLVQAIRSTPLCSGVGLPGRVLKSGKPVWVHDVRKDNDFPRGTQRADLGVRGAFAVPVLVGRKVVAVLEFFSEHPEREDDLLLELVGYVGTQLGRVAERDKAARELIAQAEQTRRLIEVAFDAFIAMDERGHVTSWNQAAETMFGWSSEEIIGRPLATRIIPLRMRDKHLEGVRRYLTTSEATVLNQRTELIALRKDGREIPVEVAVWPVEQDGRITFCAVVHDITDRKAQEQERERAEATVRNSMERLAVAQEMAAVGSWEWDIENNTVHWSDQLYRNFSVTPDEFAPSFESYMSLVHPDDRGRVAESITRALDDLGTFDLEHRVIRTSDGALRIHHCQGRVLVAEGRAVTMAGTNQDITERRRQEDALKEAYHREREMVKRLEQLDTARNEFVSAVSHELRTPLTSIIGYLQLVMDMGHEITGEHIEMLDVVDRNSQRLLSLIEDLLTKSRLESGRFTLNIAEVELQLLIDAAVKAMLPSAAERNVSIMCSVDPDLGPIDADGGQIERVLLNLLSNAVKFTDGGAIHLHARRNGDEVEITVADTGIGIAAEDIPHLFTPYFRTPSAERTRPGTGLGLALVKGIVDAHGGAVAVTSELGVGTTVTITLPLEQPDTEEAVA